MEDVRCDVIRWEQFLGNVVLGSSNMSYRDENSILDQKYEKQIPQDLYYEDLNYY